MCQMNLSIYNSIQIVFTLTSIASQLSREAVFALRLFITSVLNANDNFSNTYKYCVLQKLYSTVIKSLS